VKNTINLCQDNKCLGEIGTDYFPNTNLDLTSFWSVTLVIIYKIVTTVKCDR
jgi:hypothetical protein